ncbi:MAG: recombinase family protein, partial [Acidobacteria bacterium]|nr:recombinase family protein [Acidobacteriota bacterium]
MRKRVIELIRVSTENQAGEDRASIPAQRAINRRTAQAYGLDIVKSFELADVSGAAVLMTPEIQQLMRMIQSPEIHGVVAREFSRLMRPENFSDYALLQSFADSKTVLYLPDGPIDLTSKQGRLLGTIRAAIAGLERTELLERSWSAKEEMRRRGECPSGHITWPFGVSYDDERGWHYKPEAEKVREAFRLFLSGFTNWSDLGRRTGLSRTALRIILSNPIYTGWRLYDKRRDPSASAFRVGKNGRQGDRKKMCREPEEIIRVKVIEKPLISQADFDRVQAMIAAKAKHHWKQRGDLQHHHFVYNGFLTCAKCASPIYTISGKTVKNRTTGESSRYDYYVCRQRAGTGKAPNGRIKACSCDAGWMKRQPLEEKLDELFAERLTDNSFVEDLLDGHEEARAEGGQQAKISRLQREIESLRTKRERVLDAFFEDVIGSAERDIRLAAVERDLALAQEMLMREAPQPSAISADEFFELLKPFYTWKALEREDKRRLLSTVIPEIKVADYRIHGFYLLPPSGYDGNGNGGQVRKPAAAGLSDIVCRSRRACWRSVRSDTAKRLAW